MVHEHPDTREMVIRLDERLRAVHEDTTEIRRTVRDHTKDCEKRVGSLESSRAKGRGALGVLAAVAGWVGWEYWRS